MIEIEWIPVILGIVPDDENCECGRGDHDPDDNAGACAGKLNCGLAARGTPPSKPRGGPEQCRQGAAGKRKMSSPRAGAGSPAKRQRGSDIPCEGASSSSELKHTAGGGANLPRTQRYNFYRYFGTSKCTTSSLKAFCLIFDSYHSRSMHA